MVPGRVDRGAREITRGRPDRISTAVPVGQTAGPGKMNGDDGLWAKRGFWSASAPTWKNEPQRRSRGETRRQIDSIVAHLQRILNTRQCNVPIAHGYGVPDLTDFMLSYPESVTEIEKSLRQAIEEYEPRLSSVRVSFIHQEDDLLCLRFQIVARLHAESGRNVLIETIVDSDGKVSLKG
jgi:type VI secretion system protein